MSNSRQNPSGKPGQPIKGSLRPFLGTKLEELHRDIKFAPTPGQLTNYRNALKDAIAQAARAKFSTLRRPVSFIDDQCCSLIRTELASRYQNPHVASFVCCAMDFFNETREHLIEINQKCPSLKSKRKEIAAQHDKKDTEKLLKCYVNDIVKKLRGKNGKWGEIPVRYYEEYTAIFDAARFLSYYYMGLLQGRLPKELDASTFTNAAAYDGRIFELYQLNANNGAYCIVGSHGFSTLNIVCATYILCRTMP